MHIEAKAIFSIYLGYIILIFVISSMPGNEVAAKEAGVNISNDILHIAEFAILGSIVGLIGLNNDSWGIGIKWYYVTAFFSYAYAFLDEIHQSFMPLRVCDPWDFIMNLIGIGGGIFTVTIVVTLYYKIRERRMILIK